MFSLKLNITLWNQLVTLIDRSATGDLNLVSITNKGDSNFYTISVSSLVIVFYSSSMLSSNITIIVTQYSFKHKIRGNLQSESFCYRKCRRKGLKLAKKHK